MPNLQYNPNDPRYYTTRRKEDGGLSIAFLMTTQFGAYPNEEVKIARASKENMRALMYSAIPSKADDPEKLQELVKRIPGLKLDITPEERLARRALSERARNAIVDAASTLWAVNHILDGGDEENAAEKEGKKKMSRTAKALLLRDDSDEGMASNWELDEIMVSGTPKQRGDELAKKVNASMALFMRIINGEVTDEELVDNFEQMHFVSNLAANAQLFIPLIETKDDAERFEVTPDIKEKLVYMERHSGEVSIAMERVRMIASANYENLNLDYLMTADERTMNRLEDYLGVNWKNEEDTAALNRTLGEYDLITWSSFANGSLQPIRKVRLMEQIERDFPEEKNLADVKFVGKNGNTVTTRFTLGNENKDVDNDFYQGHVLVTTPTGDAACYFVKADGMISRAKADDMMNDTAAELEEVLKELREANKGLFIGSREYSNTLSGLEKMAREIKALGNPPDPGVMSQMKVRMEKALANCQTYLQSHAPDTEDVDYDHNRPLGLLPERRRVRYEAMDHALSFCKKNLSLIDLHDVARSAEKNAAEKFYAGGANSYSKVEHPSKVVYKAHEAYHRDFPSISNNFARGLGRIPRSNAGFAAEALRASIEPRLDKALEGNLTDAGTVMADLVLLELVKRGRTRNPVDQFDIKAGEIEWALSKEPDKVIDFFRNHPLIKNMTREVTMEKFQNFILDEGAKKMADHLSKVRQESGSSIKADLKKQNEKIPGMK